MERRPGSHSRQVGNRRYVGRKKSSFWAVVLGLAILAALAWGVYEIFDEENRQEVHVGEGEIGWINEESADEVRGQAEYGELQRPAE